MLSILSTSKLCFCYSIVWIYSFYYMKLNQSLLDCNIEIVLLIHQWRLLLLLLLLSTPTATPFFWVLLPLLLLPLLLLLLLSSLTTSTTIITTIAETHSSQSRVDFEPNNPVVFYIKTIQIVMNYKCVPFKQCCAFNCIITMRCLLYFSSMLYIFVCLPFHFNASLDSMKYLLKFYHATTINSF